MTGGRRSNLYQRRMTVDLQDEAADVFCLCPAARFICAKANMDFGSGGEWGWNTNNTVRGFASKWQNPGDGFGTGCVTYTTTTVCIPSGEGGDFSFALIGKGH